MAKKFFTEQRLSNKIIKLGADTKNIKTWYRDSIITKEMIGYTILIHNGKEFIKRFITKEIIGRKLGEFAPTRKIKKNIHEKEK